MAGTSAGAKKGWANRKGIGAGASLKGSGSKFVNRVSRNLGGPTNLTANSHSLRSKKSRDYMAALIAYNSGKGRRPMGSLKKGLKGYY